MGEPTIEDYFTEDRVFPPSADFVASALAGDRSLYEEAEADLEAFWARQARELVSWDTDFDTVLDWDLPFARWFDGGTLNVPAIVGFGKAAELCRESADADTARLRASRDRLWSALSTMDGIGVNGPMDPRLPNNLNVRVSGVHGESLLKAIAGDIAVSSGAACATARNKRAVLGAG